MGGLLLTAGVFAAIVAAVSGAAVVVVAGALALAAALPHGHPLAGRLRHFAARVPGSVWYLACRLDLLVFIGILAAGAVLTLVFS